MSSQEKSAAQRVGEAWQACDHRSDLICLHCATDLVEVVEAAAFARGLERAEEECERLRNLWNLDPSSDSQMKAAGAYQAAIEIRRILNGTKP